MKVVLAQNMYHLPSRGGANRSNRLMVERLAQRGHECHIVSPVTGRLAQLPPDRLPGYLTARGAEVLSDDGRLLVYRYAGVVVYGVLRAPDLPRVIREVTGDVAPDWALVPSDDPGMIVLSALRKCTDRIVYLVHTLQQLPFGPRAFYPSESATSMIRQAAGIVSVSRAAQEYVHRWADLDSELIYPDVYGPVPDVTDPATRPYVTLVNPSLYKGLPILLALADAVDDVRFLGVESWATTDRDRAELASRPNIRLVPGVDDMDEIYDQTRLLLMPSLWDETFGYTCVEAMLRGIPVLASDVGGLREAKLGVDHLVPVNPIEHYPRGRPVALPEPQVPPQDVGPWLTALRSLLDSPARYAELSAASRQAAGSFVAGLDPDALEHYLLQLGAASLPGDPTVTAVGG